MGGGKILLYHILEKTFISSIMYFTHHFTLSEHYLFDSLFLQNFGRVNNRIWEHKFLVNIYPF